MRSQSRIWLRCFSWNAKLNEKHLLRLLTRKSLNMVFQAMYHGLWLLQTLIVVQSADVRRELVICYCLCFPITKSGSCCHFFFFFLRENYKIYTSYFFMWELLEQIKSDCVRIETESYCIHSSLVGGTGIWTTITLLYEHFMFPSNMHWW